MMSKGVFLSALRINSNARSPEFADSTCIDIALSISVMISRAASLSSTTSTLLVSRSCLNRTLFLLEVSLINFAVNQKVLPLPYSLSTPTLPCINSANCFDIDRPSPVPPYFLEVEVSACWNDLNSLFLCSSLRPIPVSVTLNLTKNPSSNSSSKSNARITSPSSVNLIALLA